mmetsp:Transcript_85955/g.224057  ORF Transcript_85955/g.224057 Transcript_85955/m.224057 type:complete len:354 (-) Transcript_85955:13-1074(-)
MPAIESLDALPLLANRQAQLLQPRKPTSRLVLDADAVLAGDDNHGGHPHEQAMLHHTDGALQLLCGLAGVLQSFLEVQIQDVVPIVRDRRLITVALVVVSRAHSQNSLATFQRRQSLNNPRSVLVAEGHDLHGDRELGSETVVQFGVVDDHHEGLRLGLNDLFAEMSTSATLHEVQVRVDRVGAVDGDVQDRVRVQRDERDAQRAGLLLCALRSRNCDDILEFARLELLADPLHREVCRRSGPQTDDHTAPDVVVHGLVAHLLFQLVLRHRQADRAPGSGAHHGQPRKSGHRQAADPARHAACEGTLRNTPPSQLRSRTLGAARPPRKASPKAVHGAEPERGIGLGGYWVLSP